MDALFYGVSDFYQEISFKIHPPSRRDLYKELLSLELEKIDDFSDRIEDMEIIPIEEGLRVKFSARDLVASKIAANAVIRYLEIITNTLAIHRKRNV